MQIARDEHRVQVTLELAALDPFPGVLGVAVLAPTLGIGVVLATKLHLFGWLDPWILGATPIASLLLPLGWLVVRSRHRVLAIEVAEDVRFSIEGREVAAGVGAIGLAWNRLTVGGLDVVLEPLRVAELEALREVLRAAGVTVERVAPLIF